MANTQTWMFLLIAYFIVFTIFVGLLAEGDLLTDDIDVTTNPNINQVPVQIYQATDYLIGGVPVCTANGSINFEEPDTLLFTYDPSDVTLSSECTTFCRNESSFFTDAISCPGLCANITDDAGVNHIGCAPEDDRWNFISTVIGFFTFNVNLGLGYFNWVISLVFVYFPLFLLTIMTYYSLRGI